MIDIQTTKLRNFTVKFSNSREYHIIKNEIFNSDSYLIESKRENPVIIDCGSHVGLSILYFKTVFPNSIIYGFEPNPLIFPILEENIFINNLNGVQVINKAVDTKDSQKTLHIDKDDGWYSTAGYNERSWEGTQDTEPIQIQTVDIKPLIEDLKFKHDSIDLLKVDIEGYEYKVITHIRGELKYIDNLVVEYHPINIKNYMKILSIISKSYSKIIFIQNGSEVGTPNLKELFIIKASN